jgi:hypothetical protein|tara:strand:- start:1455 stop:1700 length:246 start_codon:yes stop_codon:yes gene_type:complete
MATSTGEITTDTIVRPALSRGIVTYAEATTAAAKVYDGTTASGVLLLTLAIGDNVALDNPVEFKNGLFVATSTGSTVLHIG